MIVEEYTYCGRCGQIVYGLIDSAQSVEHYPEQENISFPLFCN